MFNQPYGLKYWIMGIIDMFIIAGIIISLLITDGEYFWGIVFLTLTYMLMVLAASAAQWHNQNGVFKKHTIAFINGFVFNLFFILVNPI